MAIITKPAYPDPGEKVGFSLTGKAQLAALVSDSYYSNTSNWKSIVIVFKSYLGNQSKNVIFDATQPTPVGYFQSSLKSRPLYFVEAIRIVDFDNGIYEVDKSLLPREEFAISLFGVPLIAPAELIEAVPTSTTIDIVSAALLEKNYKVRVYNSLTDTYSEVKTIVSISGSIITVDSPFTVTPVPGHDYIVIPMKTDCHEYQKYRFQFVA